MIIQRTRDRRGHQVLDGWSGKILFQGSEPCCEMYIETNSKYRSTMSIRETRDHRAYEVFDSWSGRTLFQGSKPCCELYIGARDQR